MLLLLQNVLYCLLYASLIKCAVRNDGRNCLYFYPKEYIEEAQKHCLVVEDAEAGLKAAIAGEMDCAAIGDAVGCGLGTYNLATFSELLKVVEN